LLQRSKKPALRRDLPPVDEKIKPQRPINILVDLDDDGVPIQGSGPHGHRLLAERRGRQAAAPVKRVV
jgi:hypothetical protein